MVQGFFFPRTATGQASIVPSPPWHYSGELLTLEYRTDPEANSKAQSQGYTIVHPSQLSKEEWRNVKRDGLILPAGKVTPSAKVLNKGNESDAYDEVL